MDGEPIAFSRINFPVRTEALPIFNNIRACQQMEEAIPLAVQEIVSKLITSPEISRYLGL